MRYLLLLPIVFLIISCGEETTIEEEENIYIDEEAFYDCLNGQLRYPAKARENSVEGLVRVEIVLDDAGYGVDYNILEDPGCGLGEASVDALEFCSSSTIQFDVMKIEETDGQKRVEIPIRFKLEG